VEVLNFHGKIYSIKGKNKCNAYLPAARDRKPSHDISPFLSVTPREPPVAGSTIALDEVPCTTQLYIGTTMSC
jgi:hypothetical protein